MKEVAVVVILDENAEADKQRSIKMLARDVRQLFEKRMMERTLAAMAEEPLPGEPEGNCHNIALAFMTDLILAKRAQGWSWVQGESTTRKPRGGTSWEHSWIECNGFVVDATQKHIEKPDTPAVIIGEAEFYYKAREITTILRRRNAKQTRKWMFKHAKGQATFTG
jgi:hypothetical protein